MHHLFCLGLSGGGGSVFVLCFCRPVLRWLSYDVAKGELLPCKRSAIGTS
ncbi:hypothetical protein HMPREF3226_00324 [Prevotella corporis]|uniref:Uncharacterized protein n=1 Tax=Prevotella corporis TaxID=28128 RepID=A0A133QM08_9BACT|nr:hypothetical protein HMPREF3226_00324 [Prevotella corporis]